MDYEAREHYRSDQVAQGYDAQFESPLRVTNFRARLVGWGETSAFSRLLEQAPAGNSLLDVACGTGRYTRLLAGRGYRVGGMDVSAQMLAIATARGRDQPNVRFLLEGDAGRLPFGDDRFDGVTCMRLFHRIPPEPRRRMLREVKRVARGWAILFFGVTTPWLGLRRAIRSRLLPGRPSNPYPVTLDEMRAEFHALGFTLQARAWVLPLVAEGLVALVTW